MAEIRVVVKDADVETARVALFEAVDVERFEIIEAPARNEEAAAIIEQVAKATSESGRWNH